MHYFHYTGNRLCCEGVAVETLARKFGTPLYVYSQRTLEEHFKDLDPVSYTHLTLPTNREV